MDILNGNINAARIALFCRCRCLLLLTFAELDIADPHVKCITLIAFFVRIVPCPDRSC